MDKSDLSIGDRVICQEDYDGATTGGMVGTVINLGGSRPGIQFDNKVLHPNGTLAGHNVGGRGKYGYCWYVPASLLVFEYQLGELETGDVSVLFGGA